MKRFVGKVLRSIALTAVVGLTVGACGREPPEENRFRPPFVAIDLEKSEAARSALAVWPELFWILEPSDPRGMRLGPFEALVSRQIGSGEGAQRVFQKAFSATGYVHRDGRREDAARVRIEVGDGELVVEGRIFEGGDRGELTFVEAGAPPRVVAW